MLILYLQPIKPTSLFALWVPSEQWLQTAASLTACAACVYVGCPKELGDSPLQRAFCLACCPQSKIHTDTHSAFGKLQGSVARVLTVVIMSISSKLQNKEHMIEPPHKAKFNFPGHWKIHIPKKWGFTKLNADEFENMVAEKQLILDG
uniref:Uncharacterized protein n=1 Tax=Sus scrofa TaxID=9823 RepID=A0A8D2BMD0_PIG